jgi:hypothetical protein
VAAKEQAEVLPVDAITGRIVTMRRHRVLLDSELAALYAVEVKRFNEAVKRNLARFPPDFMFQLDSEEYGRLRSQISTLDSSLDARGRGQYRKYLPYAFTEHGAIMAATVLNSSRAIEVSVYVVRAFVRMRELSASHHDLARRLDALEEKTTELAARHDAFSSATRIQLKQVFDALRALTTPPDPPKRPIGFVTTADAKVGRARRAVR